jgi:hypothetical protein
MTRKRTGHVVGIGVRFEVYGQSGQRSFEMDVR